MTDALARLERACRRRRRAELELRAALLAAVEAGAGPAAIARALGTSRQAAAERLARIRS